MKTATDRHSIYKHLSPACGDAMGSKVQRLDYIDDMHWVSYPRAKEVLAKMEHMLKKSGRKRPEGARGKRKHHLIIEAESNNGKSSILEEFEARHPIQENPTGDGIVIPFLLIELPPKASDLMVYNEMLKKLRATHQGRIQGGDKHLQVLWLLEQIKVEMLGIDELSNILQGSDKQQTTVLNSLPRVPHNVLLRKRAIAEVGAARMPSDTAIKQRHAAIKFHGGSMTSLCARVTAMPAWLVAAIVLAVVSSSLYAKPVCTSVTITNKADCDVSLVIACQNEAIVTVPAHSGASSPCTGVPTVSVVDCRGREIPVNGCQRGVNITDGCCVTVCVQQLLTGCYAITITQDPVDCVCP